MRAAARIDPPWAESETVLQAPTAPAIAPPLMALKPPRADNDAGAPPLGAAIVAEIAVHAEAPLPSEPRSACPLPRRARGGLGTLALSSLLHLALAAAALALMPVRGDDAARGGTPDEAEVEIIGAADFEALVAGARPSTIEIPPLPDVAEPVIEPEPPTAIARIAPEAPITVPEPPMAEVVLPAPRLEAVLPDLSPPEALGEIPPPLRVDMAKPPEAPMKAAPPAPQPLKPAKAQPKPAETRPVARKVARLEPAPRANPVAKAQGEAATGTAEANRQASSRGGTGGGAETAGSAEMTSYRARLVAHLARHKTYPEQARDQGIGGRNAVMLTVGRDGRVLKSALAGGSGHSILDEATLQAVRRAQPFPAMPDGGPPSFTITIGLRYDLR